MCHSPLSTVAPFPSALEDPGPVPQKPNKILGFYIRSIYGFVGYDAPLTDCGDGSPETHILGDDMTTFWSKSNSRFCTDHDVWSWRIIWYSDKGCNKCPPPPSLKIWIDFRSKFLDEIFTAKINTNLRGCGVTPFMLSSLTIWSLAIRHTRHDGTHGSLRYSLPCGSILVSLSAADPALELFVGVILWKC